MAGSDGIVEIDENELLPETRHWEFKTGVPATQPAFDILGKLVPEWAELFVQKNRKYRRVDMSLGARGIFPDIYRKTGILQDRLWEGNESTGEPTEEVIQDLIGHLFLAWAYHRHEQDKQIDG